MGLWANYTDTVGHICTVYQCYVIYAVHISSLKALYLQGIAVVVYCHGFRKLKILEGWKEVFDSLSLFPVEANLITPFSMPCSICLPHPSSVKAIASEPSVSVSVSLVKL